ncbi:MAG: lytic transglycosylase domain-containing protein [Bradyrhizobium sp.]|uniref:lytic transglycosylase domain-containing protein n=1 Tax=Bradyrhizobium sp. TaxID=376 RepID=UPI001C29AE3A|nr:lytic transglycosylase domain-containing protein [Bradyrhizobium sp.]MBU6462028.1 lytic transglycosylase domain-containing protein [Pseudomonadota bacterium]MDE2066475.1 lytic transglycosylase domain-containing protein [Bradyrhizobium sp.]MDE2242860.1 lytic transglycosylase domain-containing protein [Bradyrhizobium sp.]MDE2468499.1 lytic transglycosylase domain-containing protein [Bradyrhizobium sp.]
MKRLPLLAWLATLAALSLPQAALAQRAQYETLIATHARANLVPEALVHRVIVRESKYQASLLGRGGTIGLMQIKLATARSLGYTGTAEGLRDPNTNLMYGVKYLAGAYRAAGGNHDRAVHYYAAGYYFTAKHQRLEHLKQARSALASTPPKPLARDEIAANKEDPAAKEASGATPEAASK